MTSLVATHNGRIPELSKLEDTHESSWGLVCIQEPVQMLCLHYQRSHYLLADLAVSQDQVSSLFFTNCFLQDITIFHLFTPLLLNNQQHSTYYSFYQIHAPFFSSYSLSGIPFQDTFFPFHTHPESCLLPSFELQLFHLNILVFFLFFFFCYLTNIHSLRQPSNLTPKCMCSFSISSVSFVFCVGLLQVRGQSSLICCYCLIIPKSILNRVLLPLNHEHLYSRHLIHKICLSVLGGNHENRFLFMNEALSFSLTEVANLTPHRQFRQKIQANFGEVSYSQLRTPFFQFHERDQGDQRENKS